MSVLFISRSIGLNLIIQSANSAGSTSSWVQKIDWLSNRNGSDSV